MPEAVIVAVSRSPIGRAFKGALKDTRPDQLAAWMVQAALDKVPELDPKTIDDASVLDALRPILRHDDAAAPGNGSSTPTDKPLEETRR